MRKVFLFLVMAAASFGLFALTPSRAEAAHPRYYAGYSYPTYYRPAYYGPVNSGYYYPPPVYRSYHYPAPVYYPTYYPTYTSSYYVAPTTTYYYAPAPVVVPPRPVVREYVSFPGGYVSW